jgi:hypothetical protein
VNARNKRPALATLALGVAAAAASPAWADAAWEFTPTIEAGYLYDDNYRLTPPGTEIQVQGPVVDAALEMRTITQTNEFSFTPRVHATYFSDESELDSLDYFGVFDYRHGGQRVETRVRADFADQEVVNSEQPDADIDSGLGEPVFGDAGRVLVSNRRTRYALRPQVSWDLNQRNDVELEAGYTHVSFDRTIPLAQVGFNTTDVSAGLRTRMTERSTLTSRLRAAMYEIEFEDVTRAYGAEFQWDTRGAKDTRSFVRVGAQNIEMPEGGTELAWLAGAGVSMVMGRNELFADLARNVGPSSAGAVVTRDQLRLRFTRAFTPRLSLQAGLRGTHDADIDTTSTLQPRSYATGDVGFEWRWQEEWSLRFAYDYTWQKFEDALLDDATSSGAMASIVYQPLQRSRQRDE